MLSPPDQSSPLNALVTSARRQIGVTTGYDPSYQTLSYPGGDVPEKSGVCTDVVVRAFRAHSIDLQKEVHEDMTANFLFGFTILGHYRIKKPGSG